MGRVKYQKWKAANMIWNRYNDVTRNRRLHAEARSENLDLEGIRSILHELIEACVPISSMEREVIIRIEKEVEAMGEDAEPTV